MVVMFVCWVVGCPCWSCLWCGVLSLLFVCVMHVGGCCCKLLSLLF